jgi:3-isopropylmalate/(R)-2-methylmalate dehydratase small subunit
MTQVPSFRKITSRVALLPIENIDTDQITPARFLKITDRAGMADACFADWRKDPAFVLNQEQFRSAQILLAGHNFGCGSSREHAAWALSAFGLRVVISSSFADIFRSNALKNGIVPLQVEADVLADLVKRCEDDPNVEFEVDLESQICVAGATKHFNRLEIAFRVDPFARTCLLRGVDQLGYIRGYSQKIAAFEENHPVYYVPRHEPKSSGQGAER